jgi:hypothetical protein
MFNKLIIRPISATLYQLGKHYNGMYGTRGIAHVDNSAALTGTGLHQGLAVNCLFFFVFVFLRLNSFYVHFVNHLVQDLAAEVPTGRGGR